MSFLKIKSYPSKNGKFKSEIRHLSSLDIFGISIWASASSAESLFSTLLQGFEISLESNGFATSSFEISSNFRSDAINVILVFEREN